MQKTPNKNLRSYIQGRIFFKLPVLYYTVDLWVSHKQPGRSDTDTEL